MKLPTQNRILREDVDDAKDLIDPLNSLNDTVYQGFNKNLTFTENIACFIKELTYVTPSTYPVMDLVKFMSTLKTKAAGLTLMQAYDKSTYTPVLSEVYVPWIQNNDSIVIYPITGLAANKTYIIRLLVF